jgi:hypothetical protein
MLKEQYFGIEIEMTGITREQAAKAIAGGFLENGIPIEMPEAALTETYDKIERINRMGGQRNGFYASGRA